MSIKDYIINHTPGNLYWKDLNGTYLGCNENMARVFKLASPLEVAGKNDYDFYLEPNLVKKIIENDQMVINSGKEQMLEEIGTNAEGELATYITRKIPLKDNNDKIIGIIGTSIDITDRKQAEEREKMALTQAAEAKAKAAAEEELRQAVMVLTGSIAHDLRTPISMIQIQGELIQTYWPVLADAYRKAKAAALPLDGDDNELKYKLGQLAKIGESFQETAQRMQQFIAVTLKTLSKALQSDINQDDLVPCAIWHCIHNTLENYPFVDSEKKCVHVNVRHNFDFLGNEILMIRVLSNLIKNALEQIKNNSNGEIFITTEENQSTNILIFKDTAGGAPPEIVAHLFEGYQTTKQTGTGVGLAFCKRIMQNFGGDITCSSAYGEYIEFVLSFPKCAEIK